MNKKILPLGSIAANCVVLWNEGARDCWLVDPGGDPDELLAFLAEKGLTPALVALTHGHFDHIGALSGLMAKWPTLPVHIAPGDAAMIGHAMNVWPPDYPGVAKPKTLVTDLTDGASLTGGGLTAEVLSTPGHTPGSVCLHFKADNLLVTGDTLFAGSCGRTDFPGGSMPEMQKSLARLAKLDPKTVVVPGHGMTTTIGREVESNPYMP
ncbi:MAG: MBL fold metallo-hydrolase [Kiritimatiellae bacterium]|nr:MBL fold metallo-hydrolase [Kiritimatiellia bacterium]